MKIVLCDHTFPRVRGVLAAILPDDDLTVAAPGRLDQEIRTADVVIPLMARVDARLIATTGARLIQQWGTGLEGVDVDAASARGIYVANVPSDVAQNDESTAEHALLLMLGAARRLGTCARMFDEGTWGAPLGDALFGRRALIVGFGRIGKALARRLAAMGMTVDAIRRAPEPGEAGRHGLDRLGTPADLLRLASDADFVVSTATATEGSRGLLNAAVFHAMKPTAIVVNVSRGSVVHEGDLVAALRDGTLAGAGLDVFAEEPVGRDHPLLAMEQVFATPHVGGVTRQSYEGISRVIAGNVRAVKEGRAPSYCVNLDAVPR
ncbi:MAG: NAD(P)-dependent oxidoreductase [Vicinamibacterales bacterium]